MPLLISSGRVLLHRAFFFGLQYFVVDFTNITHILSAVFFFKKV